MLLRVFLVMLVCGLAGGEATAQISLSGESAVGLVKTAPSQAQRSVNNGLAFFGWQTDLFFSATVTDNIGVLTDLHVSEDRDPAIDYLAIRIANILPFNLTLDAGKFDLPFGNLGERRFPRRNPLYGLPLMYEYRTALPNYYIRDADLLAWRGLGYGMRLLDRGLYDLGIMVSGSAGIVDFAVAVTNGTVSSNSYGIRNINSDFGKLVRVAVTPFAGFTIGGGYSWGAYQKQPDPGQSVLFAYDAGEYVQRAAEIDVSFAREHLVMSGQGVYSEFDVPFRTYEDRLGVFGFTVEAKYTIMPRVYLAVRSGGLVFRDARLNGVEQPWDYNVSEWEGGGGYFLDRDVLVKIVRRETRVYGGSRPKDNLTALQLVVAY
jgi:hypothetical protein